jgi:organic radical activating enzyme
MHVIYYISGGCKFNCTYCDVIDNNRVNVDLDSQIKLVDTLLKIDKPFEIYLYGGEPTEYIYIHEIIKHILKNKPEHLKRVEMQTNLNVSIEELNRFMDYEYFEIAPSIHLTFLKGDTMQDLVEKLNLIKDNGILSRIDFMLEKWNVSKHIEFNNMLKEHKLNDIVQYRSIYFEPNSDDVYTGKYNCDDVPEYKEMLESGSCQESYTLTYTDNTSETRTCNELTKRNLSFKGWVCDARKKNVWIDFTGDWWECNPAQAKVKPLGNLLQKEEHFLLSVKFPMICRVDKCDAALYLKRRRV